MISAQLSTDINLRRARYAVIKGVSLHLEVSYNRPDLDVKTRETRVSTVQLRVSGGFFGIQAK